MYHGVDEVALVITPRKCDWKENHTEFLSKILIEMYHCTTKVVEWNVLWGVYFITILKRNFWLEVCLVKEINE